uniref:Reverse transcriptase domain-containing protein n=1 Tax=Oryza glaberrima TaxID=4538 RepID=I1P020_ORYGL
MSPILFNIVVDMLEVLIERTKGDGQIRGVIPHLVEDGLSILQYADDTIIFLDHDLEHAKNMKAIMRAIVGQKLIEWNDLILRLANITLANEADYFVWSLHKNGQFSIQSMYIANMNSNVRIQKRILWDLKIPLKIKVIFMSSYWLHFWSTMLPQEEYDTMCNGAMLLVSTAEGLLLNYGWRSSIRIAS